MCFKQRGARSEAVQEEDAALAAELQRLDAQLREIEADIAAMGEEDGTVQDDAAAGHDADDAPAPAADEHADAGVSSTQFAESAYTLRWRAARRGQQGPSQQS